MAESAERAETAGAWAAGRLSLPATAIIALVLIAVAYGRTTTTLWRMWSHNDTYSHGFLIAPVSIFLVWSLRKRLRTVPASPSWAGLGLVALAVLMQVAGVRGDVTMFQAHSLILLVAGLVWTWFGFRILRLVAFPIAFLLFAAPTFPVVVNQLSFHLKTIAAFGSILISQAMGVPVVRQGMDLYLPTGVMTIEGACSGLNSLIALMALGALFAYLGTGPAWRRWLLFLLSVPVALAGNIVRITSLCVYAGLTDTTRATGLFHNIGGFVLFSFALVALFALKRLLRC